MSKIKVIALDLDGTLTNEQKIITPKTLDVLMRVQQKGVRLVLASGRPPYGMRPLAAQLDMSRYGGILLCYNGGHVEDCTTGEVFVEQTLDESMLPLLTDCQKASGMTLMTYYEDSIYTEHPDDPYVAISSRNNKMSVVGMRDFLTDVPHPVNKCLMVGAPDKVSVWEERIKSIAGNKLYVCHSTPYFIELLPPGIDKGPSLDRLMHSLGMDTTQLMAFGDSYNDIGMIKAAGIGVAMSNAEQAVKDVADYVTLSNEEDGVGDAIEKLLHI